jgi:hypothetical protein
MSKLFFVAVLLASLARAQELPNAPSSTPKKFWASAAIYGASMIADGESTFATQSGRPGHGSCWESNAMIYGHYPGRLRFYGTVTAIAIPSVLVGRKMVRSASKVWQIAGYALINGQTAGRFQAAIHNARLNCK